VTKKKREEGKINCDSPPINHDFNFTVTVIQINIG